jgi:N6-adenosine-specific RNA methylase IME4
MPPPAPGLQRLSWFQANRGRHSEKPDCVYTIIEQMFPSQPKLEMFARKSRDGWSVHGNESFPGY